MRRNGPIDMQCKIAILCVRGGDDERYAIHLMIMVKEN